MALTKSRQSKIVVAESIELDGKNEQVYKGGRAFFDTSTGLVAKGFDSTSLIPIGRFGEDSAAAAEKKVLVLLDRPLRAQWMQNATGGNAVVTANIGGLAYVVDDDTVANNDATNTLSVLGRIWKLDAVKGVLVEPLHSAGSATVSGLD